MNQFRKDINGLRAWAVAAVMLYHFRVPGFGGGFVGVDVFFVISGFLMTGIVIRGLERGDFSFIAFYLARARRIIPALAVLCALLMTLGWAVLTAPDYKQLASHAVYSLSFLSNFEYWQEAGYFDVASHEKWLLHTWSLSVEWQFYMLLPLMLWSTWRLQAGRRAQAWMIGAGCVLSLAASIVVSNSDPAGAFFLLHTRAWEMLAGAIVFLLGQRKAGAPWLEAGGLLMIVASLALLDRSSTWPGWYAMLPVAGTMLVLLSDGASPLTANGCAQWLGQRSYSLYLWHWPACVTLFYLELSKSPLAIAAGLAATLVLADVSFRWVEQGVRSLRSSGLVAAAVALVLLQGAGVWKQQGMPGRSGPEIERVAAEAKNFNPRRAVCHGLHGASSPSCLYGGAGPKVIMLGDSHASALITALAQAGEGKQAGVMQWTYTGCPYVNDMLLAPHFQASVRSNHQCIKFNGWVRNKLGAEAPTVPVVIVGRYALAAWGANELAEQALPRVYFSTMPAATNPAFLAEFSRHVVQTACEAAGKRTVYLVRPIPEMAVNVPATMARRLKFGRDAQISISMDQYMERNAWIIAAQDQARASCGARILDPLPYLCRAGRCYASQGGRPLYSDENHLSEFGNKLLTPMFREVFQDL